QVIDGKNAIITQSNIYQFADATESNGNEWAFEHGDWGRSRRVSLDYENQMKSLQTLINAYCYPNPLKNETGTIRIETNDAEKTEMRIYDVAGFLIESKSFDNVQSGNQIHEWLWQTENIESGVYFVNVQVDDLVPKIIKIAVIH
ncbi:MAG: T9SS type A sorting domain-containing protein, partial [Candidatus Marinimicrobia bacterium]|nr:T9SS type A sorting domain-containing protein [Candidatus Neomarinimicrobiota bacterium]MBT4991082.1 T9SS type A sorting domain-containing protein [Candidatus Neomarinimicrobiota bacterium]MBT5356053.1 T9SS type A sorting domain-containing protein [Candidatus Neomarinimicrobiota bacterium]MBT7358738.1 T9SS type A sorting domain-containing protein [Candidatus Neomarinimicrobiota bacterium]